MAMALYLHLSLPQLLPLLLSHQFLLDPLPQHLSKEMVIAKLMKLVSLVE
jgi:hypothetical protein